MLSELRREPTLLVLNPDSATDVLQYTGRAPTAAAGLQMAAGRGVLVAHRQPTLLQVATGRVPSGRLRQLPVAATVGPSVPPEWSRASSVRP